MFGRARSLRVDQRRTGPRCELAAGALALESGHARTRRPSSCVSADGACGSLGYHKIAAWAYERGLSVVSRNPVAFRFRACQK